MACSWRASSSRSSTSPNAASRSAKAPTESRSRSYRRHQSRTSAGLNSSVASSRWAASKALTSSAAPAASSSRSERVPNPSGGDELIEHFGQVTKVGQLAGGPDLAGFLAQAVDPDRGHLELARGHDVVVEARGDVHIRESTVLPFERAPVAVRRLVRADLGGDDRAVEGNADRPHGSVDQVAVRVGQDA